MFPDSFFFITRGRPDFVVYFSMIHELPIYLNLSLHTLIERTEAAFVLCTREKRMIVLIDILFDHTAG